MTVDGIIGEFTGISLSPGKQAAAYKAQGRKLIGVLPYYVPEEIFYAAGILPMGVWGRNGRAPEFARQYCAPFYCAIAQSALEMALDGTLDLLDGIVTPVICDTLRPMSQNFKAALAGKMPVIFLAHPQNRFEEYGIRFTAEQYAQLKREAEEIAGAQVTGENLLAAIRVYNAARKARREFVKLAGDHADILTPTVRSAVLKAACFMDKADYAEKLSFLNSELARLPVHEWKGVRIVTSGIICDNPALLAVLEDNDICIAADDVAYESRSFRTDVPEDIADPILALAAQFANTDYDVLLYDRSACENRRGEYVASLVRENRADGLVVFMQQFCDPEEMEYPSLVKALDQQGIPHLKVSVSREMRDFSQASTAIEAFACRMKAFIHTDS